MSPNETGEKLPADIGANSDDAEETTVVACDHGNLRPPTDRGDFTSHDRIPVLADDFPTGSYFRSVDSWLVVYGIVTRAPTARERAYIRRRGDLVYARCWSKAAVFGERGPMLVDGLRRITEEDFARACRENGWERS